MATCEACFDRRHYRCRGCDCNVCDHKRVAMNGHRVCKLCGIRKKADAFGRGTTYCRACCAIRDRRRYEKKKAAGAPRRSPEERARRNEQERAKRAEQRAEADTKSLAEGVRDLLVSIRHYQLTGELP